MKLLPTPALLILVMVSSLPGSNAARAGERGNRPDGLQRTVRRVALTGSLERAFQTLSNLSGMKMAVDWDSLAATGVSRSDKVVLKPARATVAQLLDMVLIQSAKTGHPLSWETDGELILVTTQMRVLHKKRLASRPRIARPRQTPAGRAGPADRPAPAVRRMDFDAVALEDVIDFFRSVSGVNFHVNWASLELTGVTPQTPITLQGTGLSVARALDLVCDQLNAGKGRLDKTYWVLDRGVVRIASGTSLNQTTSSKVFDVADLLVAARDFSAPEMDLQTGTAGSGSSTGLGGDDGGLWGDDDDDDDDQDEDDDQPSVEENRQALIQIIQNAIGEDMWKPIGKGSITIFQGKMIITQTPLGFKLLGEAVR